MKLRSQNGTGVESNTQSKSLEFGIGDASVVIEILRNRLYANPIQTLVQEYICNGRDACREAKKQDHDLTITIPTRNDPVFKVRDFGSGISPDRIEKIFVLYGSSTKRDSDKQTGGFGIGAKSAWAYTDNFTIITYVDGIARHYIAHIGKNNNGSLELISESKTKEPNGTQIQIGVKPTDYESFAKAIYRATFFWDNRPKLLGLLESELPEWYVKRNSLYKTNKTALYKTEALNNMFRPKMWTNDSGLVLVVDGVPYQVSDSNMMRTPDVSSLTSIFKEGCILTVKVGNGDVEVSASREKISDSEYSRKGVDAVSRSAKKEIESDTSLFLNSSKNLAEFLKRLSTILSGYKLTQRLTYSAPTKTYTVDTHFGCFMNDFDGVTVERAFLKGRRGAIPMLSVDESSQVHALHTAFIYEDSSEGKITTRAKIRKFLSSHPEYSKACFLSHADLRNSKFLSIVSDLEAIPLSSLPYDKKEKTSSKNRKGSDLTQVSIHSLSVQGQTYYSRVIKTTKTLDISALTSKDKYIYLPHSKLGIEFDKGDYELQSLIRFLTREKYNVCAIAPTFVKKIEKCKNFVTLSSFLENLDKSIIKTYLAKIRHFLLNQHRTGELHNIIRLSSDKDFLDPVISSGVKLIKDIEDGYSLLKKDEKDLILPSLIIDAAKKNLKIINEESEELVTFFNHLSNKYPLYSNLSFGHNATKEAVEDFIMYINAKFKG